MMMIIGWLKKTLKVAGNVEKIHGIGVDLNRFRNLPSNYSPLSQRAAIGINSDVICFNVRSGIDRE